MNYPKLSNAFICGLKDKHNLLYDDVKTWIFCGGQANPKVINKPHEFTAYENYFHLCFPNSLFPKINNECVCGQSIVHNCYIRKDTTSRIEDILIIGSCCIKKFIESGKARKCERCNADHKNRKYNICNDCKEEDKKEADKYNNIVCFDIPYKIYQDTNSGMQYGMRWDNNLKIRYCRNIKSNNEIIEYFKEYIIKDIKDFTNKRKTKHIEYVNIKYSKEAIEDAKKNGLKFDGKLKKWYKQY